MTSERVFQAAKQGDSLAKEILGEVVRALSVGLTNVAPIGSTVDQERPLAIIHASSEDTANVAAAMIREAYEISDSPPAERPLVYNTLAAD